MRLVQNTKRDSEAIWAVAANVVTPRQREMLADQAHQLFLLVPLLLFHVLMLALLGAEMMLAVVLFAFVLFLVVHLLVMLGAVVLLAVMFLAAVLGLAGFAHADGDSLLALGTFGPCLDPLRSVPAFISCITLCILFAGALAAHHLGYSRLGRGMVAVFVMVAFHRWFSWFQPCRRCRSRLTRVRRVRPLSDFSSASGFM